MTPPGVDFDQEEVVRITFRGGPESRVERVVDAAVHENGHAKHPRPLARRRAMRIFFAAALLLLSQVGCTGRARPTSTQDCAMGCQATQTTCGLQCQSDTSCVRACAQTAETCLRACTGADPNGAPR